MKILQKVYNTRGKANNKGKQNFTRKLWFK